MLILWVVAASLWVIVTSRVLLRFPPRGPAGLAFLLTVATQGVSLVAASLAVAYGETAFVYVAFVLWMLGIALYLAVELHTFDYRRVTTGPGDQWIFGGAVAITVLAGAKLLLAVRALGALGGIEHDLETAVSVAWALAMPILILLVWSELAYPRLDYSALRWATVFPVGMYATCTLVASAALGQPWMDRYFADWWVWVGLGVWIVVGTGLMRRITWMLTGRMEGVSPERS